MADHPQASGYVPDMEALQYVIDCHEEYRKPGTTPEKGMVFPTLQQLRDVVVEMFWVSVDQDEGRPLRPVVTDSGTKMAGRARSATVPCFPETHRERVRVPLPWPVPDEC